MDDYTRISQIIEYLNQHRQQQPTLARLADVAGLSEHHFQRLFSRWAGVSPKKFLQCLTHQAAKQRLQAGHSVLATSLDVGLSGPGRLHDLTVSLEAASPGEIKSGGQGMTIDWGVADSPFGPCLVAQSERGICKLAFLPDEQPKAEQEACEAELQADWPAATLNYEPDVAASLVSSIFAGWSDTSSLATQSLAPTSLRCFVKGTQFQVRVWRALLELEPGRLISYGQLAGQLGQPTASRAVGSAVGKNSIGYLIPCHRVIRETGVIGQYRWGSSRKQALIAAELARTNV